MSDKPIAKQFRPRLLWLLPLVTLLLVLWEIPLVALAHRQVGMRAFLQAVFQSELSSPNDPWPVFVAETETLETAAWHLRQASDKLDMHRTLGVVALAADNPASAQQWLLRWLEKSPDDGIAQFYLGETYFRLGDTSTAIEQWEALGAKEQLLQLAGYLVERGAQTEALEALAAVMRVDKADVGARKLAAKIWTEQGNLEHALIIYQEIIAIDPQWADGYLLSGQALLKAGHYEQAIVAFEQALQRKPVEPYWALTDLGRSHVALGQWPEAIEAYEQAIREDSTLPNAYLLMGDALFRQESYEQAVVAYDEALRRNPAKSYRMLINLGKSRAALGRWPEAVEAYQQAIHEDPALPNAYVSMGDAQCQLGHPEEARFHYEQAIALGNQRGRVQRAVEYIAQHGECLP